MEMRLTAEVGMILSMGKRAIMNESIANSRIGHSFSLHSMIPIAIKTEKTVTVDQVKKELG